MKFNYAKKILPLFILAFSIGLFSSCQDVVFDNIRREVKLEEGKVAGDIRAVVRFKDFFYLANGGILYKGKDSNFYGAWIPTLSPTLSTNDHTIKLAADQNYLYALVGISAENEKEGTNVGVSRTLFYSADGTNWLPVKTVGENGSIVYNTKQLIYTYLFCTNTINPSNRKAYFAVNSTILPAQNIVYALNGETATVMELAPVPTPITEENTPNAGTKPFAAPTLVNRSCVWYNGNVHFFSSFAAATNETAAAAPTMFYYGAGVDLRWGGAVENKTGVRFSGNIRSLGVTADYILVGTDEGIKHAPLAAGIPGIAAPFTTNADSTLSSAYVINSILVVNPELPELKTSIYASQVYTGNGSSNSAQFDHVGLWAYYPHRGNWNRE